MQRIVREFSGKEYYLDEATPTKGSALKLAIAYRGKGYYARTTRITDKRWGVWVREKEDKK